MSNTPTHPSRRALLLGLAASPVVATGIGSIPNAAHAQASNAGLISPNVCMVLPEVTEGPYYFDPDLVRADITEGRAGIPMRLQVQVVDSNCQPIEAARVDIWHCDAEGIYSGYENMGTDVDTRGETFLRGTQSTNASGVATFQTIYPGWYSGRTTHIHYKIFLDDRTVLTSQIFFPDALSEYLFRNVAPYNARSRARDTMNGTDHIADSAGQGAFAAIREQKEYYDAALVVGVDPNAESTQSFGGGDGSERPEPPAGGGDQPAPGGRPAQSEDGPEPFLPGAAT